MTWLVRIIGILLLIVALAMIALLVLMGIELHASLGELLGRGWLLIIMCVIALGLGVYLLRIAGSAQVPNGKEE